MQLDGRVRLVPVRYRPLARLPKARNGRRVRYSQLSLIEKIMNRYHIIALAGALMLSSGCAHSAQTPAAATEDATKESGTELLDATLAQAEVVRVFLDGVDKGNTPRALRVDRRFGFSEILLRKGKERMRLFEIEQTSSSGSSSIAYQFGQTNDGYYLTLNVEDLPKKRNSETHFYIPFTQSPLLITDRQYGLEIIIY